MDKVPLCVPSADGVNFTVNVELLFDARLAPQLLVWLKLPVVLMPAIVSAPRPRLVSHRLAGARRAHCDIGPALPVELCHRDRNRAVSRSVAGGG